MRILLHDYAGHPFQVQLSRELAHRGHEVLHSWCASLQTPQGTMVRRPDDAESLSFEGVNLGKEIDKTSFVSRFFKEREYGKRITALCERYRPDVVISGNTPSVPQMRLVNWCRRHRVGHVLWVQDIYGLATYRVLGSRLPLIGHAVGRWFMRLDKASARSSRSVVVISEDFIPIYEKWGVPRDRIQEVQNWSVLEELPLRPRDNDWARENQLPLGPRIVYTGTLSMKHDPSLLLELVKMLDERGEGALLVVSEGRGVEWLRDIAERKSLASLRTIGFQPFERMSEVLGSADILVALLEPDAGVFCVPSKVLSYMCAGRAILGGMPQNNLAAKLVSTRGAGRVTAPEDKAGFVAAARELLDSEELRQQCAAAGRAYAEENFKIKDIADRFEAMLSAAADKRYPCNRSNRTSFANP